MNFRTFRPAYFIKRVQQWRFEKQRPDAPWLTPAAIQLLEAYLKPTDVGLEWGSGRSTVWFARRVRKLYSIEDNPRWHELVRERLADEGVADRVEYQFVACEHREVDEPRSHPYAEASRQISDGSIDFALVDGNIRATCMRVAMSKLKPGGLLILDNANRYVPNNESGRHTTVHEPRSVPRSAEWASILDELKTWRWIQTSDGIWDTRMWIKPALAA